MSEKTDLSQLKMVNIDLGPDYNPEIVKAFYDFLLNASHEQHFRWASMGRMHYAARAYNEFRSKGENAMVGNESSAEPNHLSAEDILRDIASWEGYQLSGSVEHCRRLMED